MIIKMLATCMLGKSIHDNNFCRWLVPAYKMLPYYIDKLLTNPVTIENWYA